MPERSDQNDRSPYCPAHVDLVSAVERMRAILERCASATDALVCTVRDLAERIAKLEARVALYAALMGACAGIGGWIIGALVVHWISNR